MSILQKLIGTAAVLAVVLTAMTSSIASGQDSEPAEPVCALGTVDTDILLDLGLISMYLDFISSQLSPCTPPSADDTTEDDTTVSRQDIPGTSQNTPGNTPEVGAQTTPSPTGGRYNFVTVICSPGPNKPAACSSGTTHPESYARPTTTANSDEVVCYQRSPAGICTDYGSIRPNQESVGCKETATFAPSCEIKTTTGSDYSHERYEEEFCWQETNTYINHRGVTVTSNFRVCNVSSTDPYFD